MKSEGKGLRLHLTRKADLVVRLLRLLHDGARRTAADLAAEVGTTAAYLPQVMAPLVRAGWVESGAGRRGGYRVAGDLAGVSVLDVVEEVEGPTDLHCVTGDDCTDADPCEVHVAWAFARAALREHLGNTPLIPAAEGLAGPSGRPPVPPAGPVHEGTHA